MYHTYAHVTQYSAPYSIGGETHHIHNIIPITLETQPPTITFEYFLFTGPPSLPSRKDSTAPMQSNPNSQNKYRTSYTYFLHIQPAIHGLSSSMALQILRACPFFIPSIAKMSSLVMLAMISSSSYPSLSNAFWY